MSEIAVTPRRLSLGPLLANRRALAGVVLVGLSVVAAVFAPLLTPYAPDAPDFTAILAPPSLAHPLGTDDLGRDVLTRVLYGARVSLAVGIVSVLSALVAGAVLGSVAGYAGAWVEAVTCARWTSSSRSRACSSRSPSPRCWGRA